MSQPSLSSAGPLGACRKAFQVAFVPAKWGARGQRQFSRMYHGGIVFLLAAERNTSRMLGDGEVGGGWFLPPPYRSLGPLEKSFSIFAGGPDGAVVLCLGARKKGTL